MSRGESRYGRKGPPQVTVGRRYRCRARGEQHEGCKDVCLKNGLRLESWPKALTVPILPNSLDSGVKPVK